MIWKTAFEALLGIGCGIGGILGYFAFDIDLWPLNTNQGRGSHGLFEIYDEITKVEILNKKLAL